MNILIAIAIYLVGWVLSVRPALRRHMLRPTCIKCRKDERCGGGTKYGAHEPKAVRGAISDRDGVDAAWAIFEATWWPGRLLMLSLAFLLRTTGKTIGAVTLAGKLTMPEMERHERERTAEIERLSQHTSVEVVPTVVYPAEIFLTPEAAVRRAQYIRKMRA